MHQCIIATNHILEIVIKPTIFLLNNQWPGLVSHQTGLAFHSNPSAVSLHNTWHGMVQDLSVGECCFVSLPLVQELLA